MCSEKRQTQEQRRLRTQEKVAEAAFALIQQHGFANLRTASVAERAGISEGGLMHHFPNKDALTIAAIEYGLTRAKAQTVERLAQYSEDDDPVLVVAEDSKGFYFTGSFEVALDVLKSTRSNTALQNVITQYSREFRGFVEQSWVDKLVEKGMTRSSATDLVEITTSLVRGIAIRGLIQNVDEVYDRLIQRWSALWKDEKE